jgi:hypothetical protein
MTATPDKQLQAVTLRRDPISHLQLCEPCWNYNHFGKIKGKKISHCLGHGCECLRCKPLRVQGRVS